MKNLFTLLLFPLLILSGSKSKAQISRPDHVVVVILENHAYGQIIGSGAAPFINSLLKDKHCALFKNYYAITHPSQPNYLAVFAGSTFGITDDDLPKDLPFNTPNLGAELLSHGYTFAGYSEDLPSTGFSGTYSGNYARKHNPWVNWQNSKTNGIPDSLNISFKKFPEDFFKLPVLSFVIPNVKNDMYDGKDPDRIKAGDNWLKKNLLKFIEWAKRHNSLLIVTFDEDNDLRKNHIPTFFIGQMVKEGAYSMKINHYNLLRTLEEMYGLSFAGKSSKAAPISNCWLKVTKSKN